MQKTSKVRKARADKGVKRALKRIAPEDVKEILQEAVEASDRQEQVQERYPGAKIGGQKVSWTLEEMRKRFPIVELESEITERITWNGVVFQLITGAIHYVPEPIRNEYIRIRRNQRKSGNLTSADLPTGITHYPGAGVINWGKE